MSDLKKLKDIKSSYKKVTKAVDLLVLLVNKTIPIISDKLFKDIDNINFQVSKGNWDKIRALKPLMIAPLKHYNVLHSSYNVLVGSNHSLNYARKIITKWLLGSKMNDTKQEYMNKQLEIVNRELETVIEHAVPIKNSIEYFATLYDPSSEPDEENSFKVKKIADVVKIMTDMISKLKKEFIPPIKKYNESMYKESKKGGFDYIKSGATQQEYLKNYVSLRSRISKLAKRGGIDLDEKSHLTKVYIGGFDTSVDTIPKAYVGGYMTRSRADELCTKFESWVSDLEKSNKSDPVKYFKDVMSTEIRESFPQVVPENKVDSELVSIYRNLKKLYSMPVKEYLLLSSKDGQSNIIRQLKHLEDESQLQKLLNYYHHHCELYSSERIDNDLQKKLSDFDFENASWDKEILFIIDFVEHILDKIDEVDSKKIADDVIAADSMPSPSESELSEFANLVKTGKIAPLHRRLLKNRVRENLAELKKLLKNIKNIKINGLRGNATISVKSLGKLSDLEQMKYIMKILRELVTLENNSYENLANLEEKYNQMAGKLGDMFREGSIEDSDGDEIITTTASALKEIMAPGHVKPCVLKAAGFLVMLMHADKIGSKTASILRDAVKPEVIVGSLYDDNINKSEIKKVAKLL